MIFISVSRVAFSDTFSVNVNCPIKNTVLAIFDVVGNFCPGISFDSSSRLLFIMHMLNFSTLSNWENTYPRDHLYNTIFQLLLSTFFKIAGLFADIFHSRMIFHWVVVKYGSTSGTILPGLDFRDLDSGPDWQIQKRNLTQQWI